MAKSLRPTHLNCEGCPYKGIKVPGHGKSQEPDIAFVGDAPGDAEIEEGIPFVGKSGAFLKRMLHDLGFDESNMYFTNTVMCKPPTSKPPSAKAIAA